MTERLRRGQNGRKQTRKKNGNNVNCKTDNSHGRRCTNFEFKWWLRRGTDGRERGERCKESIKKRKREEGHAENLKRDDGKRMRTDGNERKVGKEDEELREIVKYLKQLDKMENKKASGKTQEDVEVAEVEVNEEEEEWDDRRRTTTR